MKRIDINNLYVWIASKEDYTVVFDSTLRQDYNKGVSMLDIQKLKAKYDDVDFQYFDFVSIDERSFLVVQTTRNEMPKSIADFSQGGAFLDNLNDVSLSDVQEGETLVYENGLWVNKVGGGSGGSSQSYEINVNKDTESITGNADKQNKVNIENVEYLHETASVYNSVRSYRLGKIVWHNGYFYESLENSNCGNIPSKSSTFWKCLNTKTYFENIETETDEILINHNLDNEKPIVRFFKDNKELEGVTVEYIDSNSLKLFFNVAIKGKIIIYDI